MEVRGWCAPFYLQRGILSSPTPLPDLWDYRQASISSFYMDARDLDIGPYAHVASVYPLSHLPSCEGHLKQESHQRKA